MNFNPRYIYFLTQPEETACKVPSSNYQSGTMEIIGLDDNLI